MPGGECFRCNAKMPLKYAYKVGNIFNPNVIGDLGNVTGLRLQKNGGFLQAAQAEKLIRC